MMKKKVLGLALMAMALIGFNGMAQTSQQCCKAQTENVKGKKCDSKDGRAKINPYEGLNLTDAQKSKLAELDSKRRAAHKAEMQARKEQRADKKADKGMNEADRKARMDARKADRMEYLKEVQAIIGPDQYVVFLENMYVNGGGQQGGKAIRQGKGGKQGFAHHKGMKGQNRSGKGQRGNKTAASNSQS